MQKLFQGMPKTDYQDVLRTVGHYVDEHGLSDVRIIETQDGLILQGRTSTGVARGEKKTETYLLTSQDVQDLVREAYMRRGTEQ